MDLENIQGLKETLTEFHDALKEGAQEDKEYAGEADELLGSITRVQETLKDVDSVDQLKTLMGDFGWDFLQIFAAVQELMMIDEEMELDFDFEENVTV